MTRPGLTLDGPGTPGVGGSAAAPRVVTRHVTDLSTTYLAAGGLQRLEATLRGIDPRDLAHLSPAHRARICDPAGGVTDEAYCKIPPRAGRPGAGVADDPRITGVGPMDLLRERSQPMVFADADLAAWSKAASAPASANVTTGDEPTAGGITGGLLIHHQPGAPVGSSSAAANISVTAAEYDAGRLGDGGTIGALRFNLRSGRDDPDWVFDLLPLDAAGAATGAARAIGPLSTSLETYTFRVGTASAELPAGTASVRIRLRRVGAATNVATDDVWGFLWNITLIPRRRDRWGNLLTGAQLAAQSLAGVRAGWVVDDLIGRGLIPADPDASTVEPGTALIEQLTYPDGTHAGQVLDDLAVYEPDLVHTLGPWSITGHRFTYRSWPDPTTVGPRFETTTLRDGYDPQGSDDDLANRIVVYYTDPAGAKRAKVVTSVVKALGTRVRDAASLTLPDGRGTEADAARIGAAILATTAEPSKAAVVTVARTLLDRRTGRWVPPRDIARHAAGHLVAVRDLGHVLRCTETSWDSTSGAARLTLGEPILTEQQRLAALSTTRS